LSEPGFVGLGDYHDFQKSSGDKILDILACPECFIIDILKKEKNVEK
jgi:hypothetical protein